jgi:lipid-binding SYLF domain-containing protein
MSMPRNTLKKCAVLAVLLLAGMMLPAYAVQTSAASERVNAAATVLQDMGAAGEKRIPEEVLQRAQAVAVFPNGAKGLISERLADGHWSAPVFIQIRRSTDATVGQAADVVLVFTNADALRTLEEGTELKLGVDASILAGPMGRAADITADSKLTTAIYAYARSKSVFSGVAMDGAVLDVDREADTRVYGADVTAKKIILGETIMANSTVKPFIDALERITAKKKVT